MKKFLFTFLMSILAITAVAKVSGHEIDEEFTTTVHGVEMKFKIMDVDEKTVKIGSNRGTAIPITTAGPLKIPSTVVLDGIEYKVVSISDSAFYKCIYLTSVEIPSGITSYGNYAFYGCTGIQKVIISDLAEWCVADFTNKYSNPVFYSMHIYSDEDTEITDLVIPDGVKKVSRYAFIKCLLQSVRIPGSVAEIASSSFYMCTSLDSLEIHKGLKYIRTNAFYRCAALKYLILPEGVERIGSSAFYGCSALRALELPNTITFSTEYKAISDYAFMSCNNLRQVISNAYSPAVISAQVFPSLHKDCILYIPVGTLTDYYSAGWTKKVFQGGIVETGDAVDNLSVENPTTTLFINDVTYPDDDYSYSLIADYSTTETKYRNDLPSPVFKVKQSLSSADSLIVEICTNDRIVRTDTMLAAQRVLKIWNLIPGTNYTYKLYSLLPGHTKTLLDSADFTTQGQVRMMNIDGVRNFRDIGGWNLPGGRHIAYDKVFRSAELTMTSRLITDAGIQELLNVQGISVEIDFGDFSSDSPVQDYLEFVHGEDYQIKPYDIGMTTTKEQYKNCFEKLVNSLREGKKVLFHCSEGADRTGTFAFLLEGLLGVSESDLAKDYELTDFYMHSKTNEQNRRYRNTMLKPLVDYVKNNFPGNTFNEKIEQMALGLGISQKDINDFRRLMISGGKSFTPGDVNDDGRLSVADVGCAINYIMQRPTSVFIFDAADMNGDGKISVTDVGMIISQILNGEIIGR